MINDSRKLTKKKKTQSWKGSKNINVENDMCRPHGYVNVETPGESKLFGELIIDNVWSNWKAMSYETETSFHYFC